MALTVEPLGAEHVPLVAALAAREDVVRLGDHLAHDPLERWEAFIGPPDPHRRLVLGAFDGALVAVLRIQPSTNRRRSHAAVLSLVAGDDGDAAIDALLRAAIEAADRWLALLRLELRYPAGHPRVGGLFAEHGLEIETHQRAALLLDDRPIDEVGLARLRPGAMVDPAPPPPWPARSPYDPASVRLRPLTLEDGVWMAATMSEPQVVWGTLQLPFQHADVWRGRFASNDPARIIVIGAEVAGALAGSGSLVIPEEPRRRHTATLGMTVATANQGRGVGRVILAGLLERAGALALTRVELEVYPDNERGRRLYEVAGFSLEGVRRASGFRDGGYVDGLAMARLHPSAGSLQGPQAFVQRPSRQRPS